MKPLTWSDDLTKAAQRHVDDIGPKGIVSNVGSDGSLPTDRMNRFGMIDETWGESNIFGGMNAREVV